MSSFLDSIRSAGTATIPGASTAECAFAYIRVSHERSAEKNISPETQRRRIEAYAREHGYTILGWYTDSAKSAFRDEDRRTEFLRMLSEAKRNPQVSVIIVYRYDRFSRSDRAQGQQSDLLKHGVRIESAEEGYYDPDTEMGAIMGPVTWGLNRLFSIKLRNVVIPNMKTNFEQRDPGTGWAYKNGGWAQFGYKAHRVHLGKGRKSQDIYKQIWLLDEREFGGKPVWQWARTMLLEWRLKERLGYDSIAARLTDAGVPTAMGKAAWSMATIQSLLGTPDRLFQYAGIAFWNREDCTDRANREKRDKSEWVVVENAHPAIVTEDECEAIWAMMQDRKRTKTTSKGRVSPYALGNGLLKCAVCGSNFAGCTRNGKDHYYACGSHLYRRGAGCGQSWYIRKDQLEDLIFRKIVQCIERHSDSFGEWVEEANRARQEQWEMIRTTAPARKAKTKQLETRMKNLIDVIGTQGATEALKEELGAIGTELERLKRFGAAEKPELITVDALRELEAHVKAVQSSKDLTARAAIIRGFTIELIAHPDTKTIEGILEDPRGIYIQMVCGAKGSYSDCIFPSVEEFKPIRFHSTYMGRDFRAA